jgi:hypothetical protein
MVQNGKLASYTAGFAKGNRISKFIKNVVEDFINFNIDSLHLDRNRRYNIPLSYTIFLNNINSNLRLVESKFYQGYTKFKIKFGRNYKKDIALIKSLRKKFKKKIDLSLDINHAYPVELSIQVLQELRKYNISITEEPCVNLNFDDIAVVKEKTGVKVMLDESIKTIDDLIKANDAKAIDVLNIKLGRLGGITKALEFVKKCTELDIPIYFGHAGELSTGIVYSILTYILADQKYNVNIIGFELVPPKDLYNFDINSIEDFIKKGTMIIALKNLNFSLEEDLENILENNKIIYSKNDERTFKYRINEFLKEVIYKCVTSSRLLEPIFINNHNPRKGKRNDSMGRI